MKKLKLVSLYLTVSLLNSCASDFPDIHPHLIDLKTQQCGEYQIISIDPLKFKFVMWHPLTKCDGYYSLSPKDTADLQKYYKRNKSNEDIK